MAAPPPPRFDDGEAYERFMGSWSRLAGAEFLDWLALGPGLRWLDVACGNGCFSELMVERCAPANVQGIDISEGQLAFARRRGCAGVAAFQQGDAQALPFGDGEFDAAAMALAINLMPDREKALAEMIRVVKPGGTVATYMWDIPAGGFTQQPIRRALDEMGVPTPMPGGEGSRMESMRSLWESAQLADVESRRIEVSLAYDGFDDFWAANTTLSNTVTNAVRSLARAEIETLKEKLRAALPADASGRISYISFANAVKGKVT